MRPTLLAKIAVVCSLAPTFALAPAGHTIDDDVSELRARISMLDDEIDQLHSDLSTKLAERRVVSGRLLSLLAGAAGVPPVPDTGGSNVTNHSPSEDPAGAPMASTSAVHQGEWLAPSWPPGFSDCTIERRRGCQQGQQPQHTGDHTNSACLTPEEFERTFAGKKPVLISGLIDDWPAHERWARSKLAFLERYGNTTCRVLSAQEFVLSGPSQSAISLDLRNATSLGHPDLFVFDSEEVWQQRATDGSSLLSDFSTPLFWQGLAALSPEPESSERDVTGHRLRWHMLSYGAHEAGLGWHTHGPS